MMKSRILKSQYRVIYYTFSYGGYQVLSIHPTKESAVLAIRQHCPVSIPQMDIDDLQNGFAVYVGNGQYQIEG